MDGKQGFARTSSPAVGGQAAPERLRRIGGQEGGVSAHGSADDRLIAFALAETQARREALLVRAERRRRQRQAAGEGRSATLLAFPPAPSLRPVLDLGPRPESCQWLYGDGPFADADKCGAPTAAGQSYCRAHLARLFLEQEAQEATDQPGLAPR